MAEETKKEEIKEEDIVKEEAGEEDIFNILNALNVNKFVDKKNGLSYVSWSAAWQEFRKRCPDASYEIERFEGKPYMVDEYGIMAFTNLTTGGQTYEMWLPVMDSNNRAMRETEQKIVTKAGKEIIVPKATMFDVNKTIMRCLVKNLAMFGLGLYIYAGEDLPDNMMSEDEKTEKSKDILSKIKTGTTEEIKLLYQQNKKKIAGDKVLMDAITNRTKELKGIA